MDKRTKIGLLGCGAIAPKYLQNLKGDLSATVDIAACADLDRDLAQSRADEFGIPRVMSTEDMLAEPDIDLIVNLTPAPAHYRTSLQVLEAGKHLFTEKPLCLDLDEGRKLLEAASSRQLKIGGAADTFLGGGLQLCRRLLKDGAVGEPIAAQALWGLGGFGFERYHKVFSGALLDLGPYYLTALVHLFGSVKSVTGIAEIRFPKRTDSASGKEFEIDRASTAAAALSFESGLVATCIATQDVYGYFPKVEVFGREGRMTLSDANMYGGSVETQNPQETRKVNANSSDGYVTSGRGLGVAEMALAMQQGREPRASGQLLFHILEVMLAFYHSSDEGKRIDLQSKAPKLEPMSEADLKALLESR